MGCDIHIFAECKRGRKGKRKHWRFFDELKGERIYGIFSVLAGVRLDIPSLFPPRGLPGDITQEVYKRYIDGKPDWHHPSWLTTEEFEQVLSYGQEILPKECEKDGEEYSGYCFDSYLYILDILKEYESVGEPSRIIFWFDN